MCSLPSSYATFRDTILYSLDILTLEEVFYALFSKEKMKQLLVGSKAQVEGLVIQGRTHERNHGGDMMGKSKSNNKDKICKYCKKKRHIKSECYKL